MPWDEVMHKWGAGQLHSESKSGPRVRNQRQAVAIMESEKRKAEGGNSEYQPSRRAAVKMKTVNLGKKGSFQEHPGAEHEALGIPLGEKIPEAAHERAAHSRSPRLRHMEASAKGFKAMHKG
jgi:hypothetical protein